MMRFRVQCLALCLASGVVGLSTQTARAADPAPAATEFFEQKIRPLLLARCGDCHANGMAKGGLSLESGEAVLTGGDTGPSIVAGKPEESLLIEAISHTGDLKMPPKQKLSDAEIADLTAWVKSGAVWPQRRIAIPLSNLFDDDGETSVGAAIVTDQYAAVAEEHDLAIERVRHGWGARAEIAPGIEFDFANLGSDSTGFGQVVNDGWNTAGGIQTRGEKRAENAGRAEDGIGMHANMLITFNLAELRKAGGLEANQAFEFLCDRAGLNDTVFGNTAASAHVAVLVGRSSGDKRLISAHVNGQAVATRSQEGAYRCEGEKFEPLHADGKYARFEVAIPGDAAWLTLVTTGAADGTSPNSINSDHTVFSGARLEFATGSAALARLGVPDTESTFSISDEQRNFWAFQKVQDPPQPAVQNAAWPRNSIDYFVLQRIEAAGLKPVGPAEKTALLRRTTFDLTGLPPTPAEIDAFLADQSNEAFDTVVDRLLASPHYGERWGRYWLDIARYAEDQAHTFAARNYPQGYRYRDWVVQALNSDMPYDAFVREQIAGDLLEGPNPDERLKALGYFALGPVYYADAGCAPKAAADELDDRIDTLSRGFLGLTVSCARCHDHKFDPISQQDYYALGGIFRSTNYREAPLVPQDVVDQYNTAQAAIKAQEQQVNQYLENAAKTVAGTLTPDIARYILAVAKLETGRKAKPDLSFGEVAKNEKLHDFILERWVKHLSNESKGKIPELDRWFVLRDKLVNVSAADELLADDMNADLERFANEFQQSVQAIQKEKLDLETAYASQVAAASEAEKTKVPKPEFDKAKAERLNAFIGEKGLLAVPKDKVEKTLPAEEQKKLGEMRMKFEELKKASPPMYATTHSLTEGKAENMPIYIRGNPAKTGAQVPRRFLSVLAGANVAEFTEGSGRKQLAEAIASRDNPLTPRVMVNRVWQQHFGRGLVGTPSNFGALGERPTHPELLDHLATQFMKEGWSLKKLHRLILLSATYQLSTASDAKNFEVDPDNRLLWRMNRRRLDVEAWRDAVLSVSGTLDATTGGPSGNLADANYRRRTVYGSVSRHELNPMLRLFDFPDPNITSESRVSTTVPLQQLFVLNGDFMVQQARTLAKRLTADAALNDTQRIEQAFRLVYGRAVTPAELELGIAFLGAQPILDDQGKPLTGQLTPWEQYAQVLLGGNEFTYLD